MMIEPGQLFCLDINVLLDATDEGREFHQKANRLFSEGSPEVSGVLLATQVLREYLVVATRRIEENGLGLSVEDAVSNVRQFLLRGSLIEETGDSFERMLEWSLQRKIRGKKLHDLQILATAVNAGADFLLTSNVDDFPQDLGITIIALKDFEIPHGERG
jgi:predicted nucleic acid-binding protein